MLAMTAVFMLAVSVLVFHMGLDSLLLFAIFPFRLYVVHRFSSYRSVPYNERDREKVYRVAHQLQLQK